MKITVVIIFLVILISLISVIQGSKSSLNDTAKNQPNKKLMREAEPIQSDNHVARNQTHAPYSTNPPTSGPHYGDGVAGAGIHQEEVADELLVHSLEHGAVIISYKSSLASEDIEEIKKAFNQAEGKKILVPRKNLEVVVALTSWGRLLKLETIDQGKIKAFIEANSDQGPEKAEI